MDEWVHAILGSVCSQDPSRAYAPGGVPLPVCARCLGVHLGLLAGVAWWAIVRPSGRPPLAVLAGILAAIVSMGLLGFGGLYSLADLSADARAATGAVFGAAVFAGLATRFGRGGEAWSARATASLVLLAGLAAGLPVVVGRIEMPHLAGGMAVAGVLAALLMANAILLARGLRERGEGRPFGSPVQRVIARLPLCVMLIVGELVALSAWRAAWRA